MTTDKYGFHTIAYSAQGWDTIMSTDMEKLDDVIHTNLPPGTLGETIGQYKAVGIFRGETKYKLAKANGKLQPCLGLTLQSGILDDVVNIQRDGAITNGSWAWAVGMPIFLDPNTAGELTQSPSGAFTQYMGYAISATTMILNGTFSNSALATTTTTTSTTTTSTTTTV